MNAARQHLVACTIESHEDIKKDSRRWATEVERIGEMDFGDGHVLVLANCRACRSTLVIEIDPISGFKRS